MGGGSELTAGSTIMSAAWGFPPPVGRRHRETPSNSRSTPLSSRVAGSVAVVRGQPFSVSKGNSAHSGDPLGELHHAQGMGSGRLQSPCVQSESAALWELA
jgi:hypothetical protein